MYGKFFASAFTGSMMSAGSDVFAVWGYVIANTVDSTVELNPRLLSAVIGATPERMSAAIAYLCAPDPDSRSLNDDGRRLVKEGAYQYRVPNHAHYRTMRDEDGRREYNRMKQREHRAKKSGMSNGMSMTVIESNGLSTLSAKAEAEAEAYEYSSATLRVAKGDAYRPPSCPIQELLALYHKHCPTLPAVRVMTSTRSADAGSRWRQVCSDEKWDQAQTLEWFGWFFDRVNESPFLSGRKNGGRPWRADFAWLMKANNFAKVIEGKYQQEAA